MDRSEFRVAGHYTSFVSRVHLVPEEPVVVDETLILAVHPSPRQEVEIKVAYQLRDAGRTHQLRKSLQGNALQSSGRRSTNRKCFADKEL